jgi:regulator of nonsense transcripts 1
MECITLLYILNNKFPKEEIKNTCIITPYLGQKELIEEYLADHMINMEVSSVDSFQGQERDYIIINTVRNNKDCEIGFLKDAKRLNVSISRAKYGLIIIGNANCLYNAKVENKYTIWRRYIDYIKNNNSLVSFNMEDDKFEKYEFNQILNNEIVEGDYEEKYDFDGSKNNYKSNMDLIYKSSEDNVSDHFYYNSVNNNIQNNYGYEGNYRRNNKNKNKRNNYNSYNEGYNQRNYNNGKNRKKNHY